jgi:Skp family chaperone for outer membrane proteins
MAMWSCAVVFALSLVSQVSYHELMAPAGATPGRRFVIGFASALPVVILALIAILIHLRHLDRADAAEADERTAVQAEMDALRTEAEALTEKLSATEAAHAAAQEMAAGALAEAESLRQKLAAKTAQRKRPKAAQAGVRKAAQDEDLTTEMRALTLLEQKPELRKPGMGSELGRQLGLSPQSGRRLHAKLTAQDRPADPLAERPGEVPGERS